jgi:alkaline phosphatase
VEGASISDYSHSWRSWEALTDTTAFADAFTAVLDAHSHDVDALALAVE